MRQLEKSLKILIVSLKWTDARPGRPLSSAHIFMDTLKASGIGDAYAFFCDEHLHARATNCDDTFFRCCQQLRPDLLFLFPTQTDVSVTFNDRRTVPGQRYFLFPRNETFRHIREKLGIPIVNAVGDAYSIEAFNRFESMADFSDKILLFDPESDFLQMTSQPKKYLCLWFPIFQNRFCPNGAPQDINLSFIGRTHPLPEQQTLPPENPLHQYAYRDRFIQLLIAQGCPVFRAGGAQNAVPLSEDMVAQYLRRSKISMNFTYQSPGKHLIRGRAWEAINSGSMLLEEENASIKHFLEPMRHYVPFADVKDAADKIRYFLSHDKERHAIAAQGLRVARENFSQTAFWTECLRHIFA
jgi:hypothetical protein